jgi:hypothetical protein
VARQATVLITSTEHYGAVLNPDFDFTVYLNTLQAAGLNLTRTVNGDFLESTSAVLWRGGDQNPLAPREGARYARALGAEQRARLLLRRQQVRPRPMGRGLLPPAERFRSLRGERGIVVEINAFYVLYDEGADQGQLGAATL